VDTRDWSGADFNGKNAPTSLDDTSLTIGGQQALVGYISPTQVNALIFSNVPIGQQQLMITPLPEPARHIISASVPLNPDC
jgi:uncharacterized protein (TIGR03437 family)